MVFILDEHRLERIAEKLMKQFDIEEDELIGWVKSHYDYYKDILDVSTYYYQEDELVHCLVQLTKSIEPIILDLIEQGRRVQPVILNALVDEAIEQAAAVLYEELVMRYEDEGYLSQRHNFDGLDSGLIEVIAKKMMLLHPSIEDFYEGALLYTYELLESLPLRDDNIMTTSHGCGSDCGSGCGSGCGSIDENKEQPGCPHCPKYRNADNEDKDKLKVRINDNDVVSKNIFI